MLQYQQSETTAERRRWLFHLVDESDGITPLTGQTGKGKVSKNGADATDTTNSMVEVDAVDMPGLYYIELTASELDSLGFLGFRVKTTDSAEFQDRAIVSYNDPYLMQGGFSNGNSGSVSLTKKQIEAIAKAVWEYLIGEKQAQILLSEASVHPVVDLTPVQKDIKSITFPITDLTPLMDKIDSIPQPKMPDHSQALSEIKKTMDAMMQMKQKDTKEMDAMMTQMENHMMQMMDSMKKSGQSVSEMEQGFGELKQAMDEYKTKVSEMSDMDKRFENMTSTMQKQQLAELTKKIDETLKKILLTLTDTKFEILNEIK